MTSGQGGSAQQPTGRPDGEHGPGAPPPPQPPAYPSAPSAPPAYPPAPGYGPAPAAHWGGPAPRPVERPVTVRAGIGAFMANLILGVISVIVSFTQLDSLAAQALATARAQGQTLPSNADTFTYDAFRAFYIAFSIIGLVLIGLQAMFLWFAWNGRNWARIVLWVIGGFGVLGGLFTLFGGTAVSGFLSALSIIQFLLVLAGVVLLALKPSNEWYRYRRRLRDTGQAH